MDTLKAVSVHPIQNSGAAQAPPKKNGDSGESVSAVATTTTAAVAETTETMPVELSDPKSQEEHKQKISNAVEDINNFFQMAQHSLGFTVDEVSGKMVMQIRDTKTNELIRQIPGEEVLKLAKRLDDLNGILFKAQA
ncbi:MAG: flagellar protein FlaG [Methylobacter sp.]|nr:MAG: flagellar protein FlaG [Methylobacter sp.]